MGEEVQASLTPGQQFIKIVNEELTEMMGGENVDLSPSETPPLVTMMVGLQGSGKLLQWENLHSTVRKRRKAVSDSCRCLPTRSDRPTQVLARTLEVPCYASEVSQDPVEIVKAGLQEAKENEADYVFIDTAGRLQIDETLMEELARIKQNVNPNEILFVADAMTGQEAVNVAKGFDDRLQLSGVLLTKMDGDARGGAALSIRAITQKPIKFVTTGEKLEDLETVSPGTRGFRILGMGDMLSLIEKVESTYSEKEALRMQNKLRRNEFTLDDFRDQLRSMRKMGQ